MLLGKAAKREDSLLDCISDMVKKRESTLRQIEAWEVTDPTLTEVLEDIRLHLL